LIPELLFEVHHSAAMPPAVSGQKPVSKGDLFAVVTRGVQGVQAWHCLAGTLAIEAPAVTVADTIGAGDSFQAALLFALHALGRIRAARLREITAGELKRALSFATMCAAFTVGRVGADPPRRADLDAEAFDFLPGQTT
jgi:fructokinase